MIQSLLIVYYAAQMLITGSLMFKVLDFVLLGKIYSC